jgi:hypothetical protein
MTIFTRNIPIVPAQRVLDGFLVRGEEFLLLLLHKLFVKFQGPLGKCVDAVDVYEIMKGTG